MAPRKKGKKSQSNAAATVTPAKATSKKGNAPKKAAKKQTTTRSDNNDLLPAPSDASIAHTSQQDNIEPTNDAINEVTSSTALVPNPNPPNLDNAVAPTPNSSPLLDSSPVPQAITEPDQDPLAPPSNASPILAEHPDLAQQTSTTSTLPNPAPQASAIEASSTGLNTTTNRSSPAHSTRITTPEIDQDIIDRSKLGNAERSLIPFAMNATGQKRKELYHAAFNRAIVLVQGILVELSEEVGMKYEKVEADMFGCMTIPKATRNARAWDAFVTQKMAERAEGACPYL
jgi:hypothetical protein